LEENQRDEQEISYAWCEKKE